MLSTSHVFAAEIPLVHPILGTWKYDLPELACFETYEFRPDGVDHITSRDEIGDSRYEVSETPDSHGFYQFTDTVVTSNGKKDCDGQTSPIGDVTSGYAMFDPSLQKMYLCSERLPNQCMGPLVRNSSSKSGP